MARPTPHQCGEHFTSRHTRRSLIGALVAVALATAPGRLHGAADASSPTLLDRSQVESPAGEPMAWRVVRDVAEVGAAAAFEQRALGFAVASAPFSTLLLTNEATGSTRRLTSGQAAFVFEGRGSDGRAWAAPPPVICALGWRRPRR